MGNIILDKEVYQKTARQMAAEGCVLLKNDNGALPLRSKDRVAVFGRCAFHYCEPPPLIEVGASKSLRPI